MQEMMSIVTHLVGMGVVLTTILTGVFKFMEAVNHEL